MRQLTTALPDWSTWFEAPWYYPGTFSAHGFVGPREGAFGRNDGVTAWGQVQGGLFKYYVGAFDLDEHRACRTRPMQQFPGTAHRLQYPKPTAGCVLSNSRPAANRIQSGNGERAHVG